VPASRRFGTDCLNVKAEQVRAASAAYECYQRARAEILPMTAEGRSREPELTAAERALLADVEDLWRADADSLADLRRYGKTISGVRRSNYKGERADQVRLRLDRDRLKLLEHGDPALWLDEPAVLGGFGLQSGTGLFNEDTLRFFRIVTLLNDAALLREFRSSAKRPVVWEIGGGWGGFAHYLKTLFPDLTYLITAPPTLLLLSATYLMTLFPEASVRFFHPSDAAAFCCDLNEVDFAFAPDSAVHDIDPRDVALTIDVGMLQRMNAARISAHVQRAFELGCRYMLSVCFDEGSDAESTVRPAIERCYWLHPMASRAYLDRHLLVRNGAFLFGWKRLRA
jgi:hypothetical protein